MTLPYPGRAYAMILAMMATPALRARFLDDPDSVMDEFEVEAVYRPGLLEGSSDKLGALGVHPSMQFKFLVATGQSPHAKGTINYYLDRL